MTPEGCGLWVDLTLPNGAATRRLAVRSVEVTEHDAVAMVWWGVGGGEVGYSLVSGRPVRSKSPWVLSIEGAWAIAGWLEEQGKALPKACELPGWFAREK